MFNQLKYSKIFFGILLFLPLNGMTATQAVEMSSAHKIPISLSGPINPAKILKVQASGGGRVEVLHVKENQHVSKDQLLLTLNNDTQKRQLKLAEIQIKLAESQIKLAETQIEVSSNNVKDLEANLKDIKRRLKDEETLFEQGSSTRSQIDVLQLQYSRGEIALKNVILGRENSILGLENANLGLKRSKHDVELREDALEDTLIKAKIGGIITAKSFEEGEVISGGAVLFQIIDIKQVEIEVQMSEEDLPMISVGQAVLFTTPSYRDVEFTGKIERISWTADPETGRFPLYVIAKNPGLKLRAGMSAKVYLLKKK
ncbi:MAG: HlyD family efflux transporter periplasmic adaptor subunit [Deltaproteobacteria bacterium]|nr:HlyD family efflux transporter periplasmic adaptor subunit [Deltaproteobacteria bacterium]